MLLLLIAFKFKNRCKVLMRLLKRIVKSDKHKKLRYGDVTYKATGPKIAKIIHFSSSQNTTLGSSSGRGQECQTRVLRDMPPLSSPSSSSSSRSQSLSSLRPMGPSGPKVPIPLAVNTGFTLPRTAPPFRARASGS